MARTIPVPEFRDALRDGREITEKALDCILSLRLFGYVRWCKFKLATGKLDQLRKVRTARNLHAPLNQDGPAAGLSLPGIILLHKVDLLFPGSLYLPGV